MGKLNQGILGGFSGTVGTVVGFTNKNGDDVIRVKSKNRRASNTEAQVSQRSKFSLVTDFLQTPNFLLKIGFKKVSGTSMSPYNYACQCALSTAVTGQSPDFALDYSKVLISQGKLSRSVSCDAQMQTDGVKFSWVNSSKAEFMGNLTDKAILLVYNVTKLEVAYSISDFTRSMESAEVSLPFCETGDKLLCYLFFQSSTESELVSTSMLAGEFTIE